MVSPLLLLPLAFIALFIFTRRQKIREFLIMRRKAIIALESIPGPPTLPLVGAAYQFKTSAEDFGDQILEFLHTYCRLDERRCGMIQVWIGPMPTLFIECPEIAKEVLESNSLITKANQYDIIAEWIGTGLLTSTNEKWYTRRKMLTPAFHFNVLKGYNEVFVRQAQVFVDVLDRHADGVEFDVFPFIKRCALDIICETAMGTHINSLIGGNSEYVDAVVRLSDIIFSHIRFPWLWLKPVWYGCGIGFEFDRLVKLTNDFTRNVINERRQTLIEEGILTDTNMSDEEMKKKKLVFLDLLLMKQQSANLSDEDIREEVDTFMFEGHDTTASGMGFLVWFLGQHPEYQAKVHAELDEVFGEDDREPEEADLKKLHYLEKCIKETLRLRPSVPLMARRLTHDMQLGGFDLPENLSVVVCPIATHRSPSHWERPDEFYPDHFNQEAVSKRHPYAYFPFSAGPRNCIGQKFAMSEEKTVLSAFFRRYRVETTVPSPGNRPIPEVILKPSDGVKVRLYKRTAH